MSEPAALYVVDFDGVQEETRSFDNYGDAHEYLTTTCARLFLAKPREAIPPPFNARLREGDYTWLVVEFSFTLSPRGRAS